MTFRRSQLLLCQAATFVYWAQKGKYADALNSSSCNHLVVAQTETIVVASSISTLAPLPQWVVSWFNGFTTITTICHRKFNEQQGVSYVSFAKILGPGRCCAYCQTNPTWYVLSENI